MKRANQNAASGVSRSQARTHGKKGKGLHGHFSCLETLERHFPFPFKARAVHRARQRGSSTSPNPKRGADIMSRWNFPNPLPLTRGLGLGGARPRAVWSHASDEPHLLRRHDIARSSHLNSNSPSSSEEGAAAAAALGAGLRCCCCGGARAASSSLLASTSPASST
jgi:hypothetical protein